MNIWKLIPHRNYSSKATEWIQCESVTRFIRLSVKRNGVLALSLMGMPAVLIGCSNISSDSPANVFNQHNAHPELSQSNVQPTVATATLKKSSSNKHTFGKLEISKVRVVGNDVHITGISDLPDGAVLNVALDVPGRAEDEESIAVEKKVIVSKGHFSTDLTRPNRPEFLKKRCVVTAMFYVFPQSDAVKAIVGDKGQNLVGNRVNPGLENPQHLDVDKDLEVSVTLPTRFSANVVDRSEKRIDPSSYSVGTPERAFSEFLASWQRQDFAQMAKACQITWCSGEQDPTGSLKGMFEDRKLLGAKITGRDNENPSGCQTELSATIMWTAGAEVQTTHLHVNVLRESGPDTPSPDGKWGVNPISATGW